jgi:hypothetical protein
MTGLAQMRTSIFLRVLTGILGLLAALIALAGPLLFLSNELQEAESAHQYGGHASFPGALGGGLAVLVVTGLSTFLAFVLPRFFFPRAEIKLSRRCHNALDETGSRELLR